MNWIEQAFFILEIEITKDERMIKKAYAKQVKYFHPEDYPEEWKRTHDAYEMALQYARGEYERVIQFADNEIDQEKIIISKNNQNEVAEQQENEILQVNENIKENNEYDDIFQKIQDSEQQKRKAILEEAKYRLDQLVENWDKSTYENWRAFLQSSLFATVCEEEEFLLYLIYLLPKVKIQASILRLLQMKMEELERELYASMQLSKAKLVSDIEKICVNEYMRNSISKMEEKSKNSKKENQRFGTRFIVSLILSIVVIVIAFSIWGKFKNDSFEESISVEMTEEQAKEEIISYLREKYPDSNYIKEDIYIKDYEGFLINNKAYELLNDKILGYEGAINDNTPFEIIVMIGVDNVTNEEKAICFDNRQEKEIAKALQSKITSMTGIEQGTAYLSADDESFIASYIDTVGYHSLYKGDLESFFNEEANYRNNILFSTNDSITKLVENLNESNINGRCSIYFSDSNKISIEQRLTSQADNSAVIMEEVLQNLASTYQIQLVGAILPQNFYQALMFNAQNDSTIYDWLKRGGNFYNGFESISPLMSPLVSSWFVSKSYNSFDEGYYGGIHVQNAVNIADGFFVLNKYALDNQNFDQLSVSNVGELQIVDIPEEMKVYLEAENIFAQKTINFVIKSFSEFEESYILAIDKAKFGIPESDYQVAITIPKTEYSDAEYKVLDVNSYAGHNTKAMLTTACEGEGYLFLDYNAMESNEMPIVVTIILE